MPDGTRRRRHSPIHAKRRWYAEHRAERFARRFNISSGANSASWKTETPELSMTLALDVTEFGVAAASAVSAIRFWSHWNSALDPVDDRAAVA
jgi:hypothetical protein